MKVTLKKAHTHAGKECVPGDEIEVSAAEAAWLAGAGVIDPVGADSAPAKGKKE